MSSILVARALDAKLVVLLLDLSSNSLISFSKSSRVTSSRTL